MFKVCSGQCDQCLFSANKIVSDKRRREIIKECLQNNSHFLCHKSTLIGEEVCCRGFFDSYGPQINLIRIMGRLNAIEEVDVNELSDRAGGKQS